MNRHDNKTVVAFLDKRKDYVVINADGTAGKKSTADIKKSYDKVDRGFKKVDAMTKSKELTQNLTKIPTPTKPIL